MADPKKEEAVIDPFTQAAADLAAFTGNVVRVKMPDGVVSVSVDGISVKVPDGGVVTAPAHIAAILIETHGGVKQDVKAK